jgi:hypothetical protein
MVAFLTERGYGDTMRGQLPLRAVVVAVSLAILGASSGAIGGPAGAQGAPRRVALYLDPMFVDTSTGGAGEAENVRATLVERGFTVDTFEGTTGDTWEPALANADVLVVPELEVDPGLADNLDGAAASELDGFIRGGRRLVTFHERNFEFLETILSQNPDSWTSGQSCPCARAGSAGGTEFEGGPLTLQEVTATATLDVTSPTVATVGVYTDADAADEAGVATIGVDAGDIVHFGWDWTFEAGQEALRADWLEVLSLAVEGSVPRAPAPATAPGPAPTPAPPPAPVAAGPRFTG